MPMTTTHALVPLAAALAFGPRPIARRLVIAAMIAAALPDIDGIWTHFLRVPPGSMWAHRGVTHSLFFAILAGIFAAGFHKWLQVRPLAAGVVIGASAASHGLLDMLTDRGHAVAYLWPLSSARLFADWRPIRSPPVHWAHLVPQGFDRFESEFWQLLLPMAAIVVAAILVRSWLAEARDRRWVEQWSSCRPSDRIKEERK